MVKIICKRYCIMCTLDVNKRRGTMDVGSMYIVAADVKGGQEKMDDGKG